MSKLTLLLVAFGLVSFGSLAQATTFDSIAFGDQVTKADTVVRVKVLSKVSKVVDTPEGQVIKTFTKVKPLETFTGAPAEVIELRTLGGTVADLEMKIDGIPDLKVNREYVLFVKNNGKSACPLVGWTNGASEVTSTSDGTTYLQLPYLMVSEAHKTLGQIIEETKKTAGETSLSVANMLLDLDKVKALTPGVALTAPATVTMDQFRNLIQFYTK